MTQIAQDAAARFGTSRPMVGSVAEGRPIWITFDDVGIDVDARAIPASGVMLELELLHDRPDRILETARMSSGALPSPPAALTRVARGPGFATSPEPQAVRASATGLLPTMSTRDAFTTAALNCLAQMQANETAAKLGRNPEGLHQFRVGLRRFRALVAAYGETLTPECQKFLGRELRWMQQELNPIRDWDVFIASTLEPVARRVPELRRGLEAAKELRELAQERASLALGSWRYAAILLRCYIWLATGGWASAEAAKLDGLVGDFATASLQRRHQRLRKFGGKRVDLADSELHRLRIIAKKQRYLSDFFCELFPRKATAKYGTALAKLQDILGSLNDARVARRLLAEIEDRLTDVRAIGSSAAARGTGIVLGWQAASSAEDARCIGQSWKDFRARKSFWRRSIA